MTKQITITVYSFDELSDESKQSAIEYVRDNWHNLYGWNTENKQSIEAFCEHFGVSLMDYSVTPWDRYHYKTDANNYNFRGVKLKHINRDYMPTGYFLDCTLWQTFYDEFKRTSNALLAFDSALDAAFKEWRSDWEDTYSNDSISERLIDGEYQFTEDGKLYK